MANVLEATAHLIVVKLLFPSCSLSHYVLISAILGAAHFLSLSLFVCLSVSLNSEHVIYTKASLPAFLVIVRIRFFAFICAPSSEIRLKWCIELRFLPVAEEAVREGSSNKAGCAAG